MISFYLHVYIDENFQQKNLSRNLNPLIIHHSFLIRKISKCHRVGANCIRPYMMAFAGCLDKLKIFNIPNSIFNFSLKVESHLRSSPIPYPMKVSLDLLGNNRLILKRFCKIVYISKYIVIAYTVNTIL